MEINKICLGIDLDARADMRSSVTTYEEPSTTIRHVLASQEHTHLDRREMHRVDDRSSPAGQAAARPSIEDIFGDSAPLQSGEDLAHTGIFDDGEVEEFIADLYAMRRSDVA